MDWLIPMKPGSAINPIEKRKRRNPLPQIALAVSLLVILGIAAWMMFLREETEVPTESWVTYEAPGGDFSLRFPADPIADDHAQEDGNDVHLVTSDLRSRVYAIAYYDYPQQEVDDYGADVLLDNRMQTGTQSIDGIITNSIELKWKDMPGREFWADVPGGKAHYRIFLSGRRLYQLAIIHTATFEANHDEFFGSFNLTTK